MSDSMEAADYVAQAAGKKPSKYRAEPVTVDGMAFDSKLEARRYEALKLMVQAGEITDLRVHPPAYRLEVNGMLITRYSPDFEYYEAATGNLVVEDVKSGPTKTRDYRIRKKLMKAIHGIDIIEVAA